MFLVWFCLVRLVGLDSLSNQSLQVFRWNEIDVHHHDVAGGHQIETNISQPIDRIVSSHGTKIPCTISHQSQVGTMIQQGLFHVFSFGKEVPLPWNQDHSNDGTAGPPTGTGFFDDPHTFDTRLNDQGSTNRSWALGPTSRSLKRYLIHVIESSKFGQEFGVFLVGKLIV